MTARCPKCEEPFDGVWCATCGPASTNGPASTYAAGPPSTYAAPQPPVGSSPAAPSHLIAAVTALFLGFTGIQWFYFGYRPRGWARLGLTLTLPLLFTLMMGLALMAGPDPNSGSVASSAAGYLLLALVVICFIVAVLGIIEAVVFGLGIVAPAPSRQPR